MIRLNVLDMETSLPAGSTSIDWTTTWTMGGQRYIARAEYAPNSGGTAYTAGPSQTGGVPITGSLLAGAGGYVEFDVPLALVGSPSPGALLTGATAATGQWAVRTTSVSAVERSVDTGGPGQDLIVGKRCG